MTITQQILDLLDLQYQTFSATPDGEGAPLESQRAYYLAKRELFRVAAESTFDMDEVREAIDAYGQADSSALQINARIKIRDGHGAEHPEVRDAELQLAKRECGDARR